MVQKMPLEVVFSPQELKHTKCIWQMGQDSTWIITMVEVEEMG